MNGEHAGDEEQAGQLCGNQPVLAERRYASRSRCPSGCIPRASATTRTGWRSLHGPLVLCGRGRHEAADPGDRRDRARRVAGEVQPVPGRPSTFAGSPTDLPAAREIGQDVSVTLEPFYKMHGDRHYVVYWDVFTPSQWKTQGGRVCRRAGSPQGAGQPDGRPRQTRRGAERERSPARGREDQDAERFSDRRWRARRRRLVPLRREGPARQAQELSVTYWGSDSRPAALRHPGGRQAGWPPRRLDGNRPEQFYDQTYPLPADLTKGKSQVTVTFQAHPGQMAGGVFGLRVLKTRP